MVPGHADRHNGSVSILYMSFARVLFYNLSFSAMQTVLVFYIYPQALLC